MKCSNPVKSNAKSCDGEMKPLPGAPQFTECVKCGYRIDTPKAETKKPAEKKEVSESKNKEN